MATKNLNAQIIVTSLFTSIWMIALNDLPKPATNALIILAISAQLT